MARTRSRVRTLVAYGTAPALGLASGPLLARALGPEGRGQFAAIMQPITLAGAVASIGVPTAVAFFVAAGHDRRATLVRAMTIIAGSGIVVYGVMAVYGVRLAASANIPLLFLLVAWLAIPHAAFLQVFRGFWQGQAAWRRLDLERFSAAVLRFAAVVGLVLAGATEATAYAGFAILSGVLAGFILLRRVPNRSSARRGPPTGMLRYSLASAGATIALIAGARLDQLLMPLTSTVAQLGYYAVAVTVAEAVNVLSTIIAREALHASTRGHATWSIVLQTRFYWLVLVGGCLSAIVLAPYLIPVVFSDGFRASIGPAQVLAAGVALSATAEFSMSVLAGAGRPLASSMAPMTAVLMTVIAYAAFWGDISAFQAALISTIAQACAAAVGLSLLLAKRRRHDDTLQRRH